MPGESKPNLTFDRWLIAAAGVVTLLLLGTFVTLQNIQRLKESSEWVAHSHEVMDVLAEINGYLREAESAQRTYLIVGGDEIPDDFVSSLDAASSQLEKFRRLTVDNSEQQAAIPDIERRMTALRDTWTQTIQARQTQGIEAASELVRTNQGRAMASVFERRLREMDGIERNLLRERLLIKAQAFRWTLLIGLLSALAAIAGILAFVILLRRHLSARSLASAIIAEQGERLRTTLASIGDAVITTDTQARITGMNAVAESLTGWNVDEAAGRPLGEVFRIVNESTRQIVENPAAKALAEGTIVGLANHTVLITKDGAEYPIDDSAAPIRCAEGQVVGCVLVFRNVAERRTMELKAASRLADARRLAAIVESSNDAIISKTLDGIIQSWNIAAEKLFGYPAEKAVGQHISLVFPPDRLSEEEQIIARLRKGERIEHYETIRRRSDGTLFPVALTISPICDESGTIVGASKIAHDITERMQAEEALSVSEERFRMLADNMSQFCWMADEKGWVFWYNQRWFDYTGTTLEQMQGWGWKQVHHPDHVDRVVARVQHSWDTGELWEDTFPLRGKDGAYRWFLSRAVPIRDSNGKILRWFGTNTDVTERRQLEEDLRNLAADLSQADRRKDEFLATLAHELRNPLAAIYGASELLNVVSSEAPEFGETVDIVHRQAELMVRLIDDLMDVSRITSGKLTLRTERVDLASAVQRAIESTQTFIEESHHKLTVDIPESTYFLEADAVRLSQVFANLLNNAVKYSEPGTPISVVAGRQGDSIVVTVKDEGIGIEADKLQSVFEMFSQIHSVLDRPQDGLGIGLSLVRGLVEMHNGSIEVRSEGLGKGTEFVVCLPLLGPENTSADDSIKGQSLANNSACRILIADDNRDLAQTLAAILRIKGHEVLLAFDGVEAFQLAQKTRPHVMLLDIGMPAMNGLELAQELRKQSWAKHATLAAMTGWGQEEDRQRTRDAGFDVHLTKPVGVAELEQLLNGFNDTKAG